MALLDPIIQLITRAVNGLVNVQDSLDDPPSDALAIAAAILLDPKGLLIEGFRATVTDPVAGDVQQDVEQAMTDAFEEIPEDLERNIIEELPADEVRDISQVRNAVDEAEGGAFQLGLLSMASGAGVEALSLGQVDGYQFELSQIMSFLALEDMLGAELEVIMREGVAPSLEAAVNQEYRSQFVNLQDVVEQGLRNKDQDTGWLPDISTYGIRPADEPILEEVAINDMEFEELLETPAELGLVVPDDVLDAELDRSGYAEDTKDFLRETVDRLPKSVRTYQELVRTEDLVTQLDTLVEDEELSPNEAAGLFPDDTELDKEELRERFRLLQQPPSGAPTRSLVEDMTLYGYRDLDDLQDDLDRLEYNTGDYEDAVRVTVLTDLDGALQEAVALGLMTEGRYADLAEFAGVPDPVIDLLLQGASFSDIVEARLAAAAATPDRSVRTIVGIGESRGPALIAAGIETVADLAGASVSDVEAAAGVSPETAQQFIQRATNRLQ